jgi:HEAT repeat protein
MRRAKLLLLIFGLSGLGVVVVFGIVFKDVAIEAWYLSELESADDAGKKAAIEKLAELKSRKAIPPLVAMTLEESELADAAEAALEGIGAPAVPILIRSILKSEAGTAHRLVARNAAVLALRILEKHPEEIIGVLRAYDENSGFCDYILQRFLNGHDDISASLIYEPLRDRESVTRCGFLNTLSTMSETSRVARNVLLMGARDESAEVRVCALNMMRIIRDGDREFEDVLVEVLQDSVAEVRIAAAAILTRRQPTTDRVRAALLQAFLRSEHPEAIDHALALAAAVPDKLIELFSHESVSHRRLAIAALADTAYAPARDAYLTSLQSDVDGEVRLEALRALGSLGEQAAEVVPALLELLRKGPEDLRAPALLALGQIGARPELVVPVLVEQLTGEDAEFRRFAAAELEKFGEHAAPAIPALIKALEDLTVADWAVFAQAACGTQAVKAIVGAFDHKIARVRWRAVMAIERMGRSGAKLAEAQLCGLLSSDPDSEVRGAAATALGRLGSLSDATLTKIEGALGDSDWSVRLNALEAFARGDETNARADKVLSVNVSALRDPDVDTTLREEALGILRLLGEKGIRGWIAALDVDDAWIQRQAISELTEFGPTASEAVPALESKLKDTDPDSGQQWNTLWIAFVRLKTNDHRYEIETMGVSRRRPGSENVVAAVPVS